MNRFCALILLLIVGASPTLAGTNAPDTQIGNFLFQMPNGWTPTQKGDSTTISAPGQPRGTATYFALGAFNLDGNLQNSFNELWGGFKNSYRILQGGQITSWHSPNGYDAYYTNAVGADAAGTIWTMYIMGGQYKNRLQSVAFMSSIPPGTMLQAYENTFQQKFLASLSFGDALPGAKVSPPLASNVTDKPLSLAPGQLAGIYAGFELSATGGVGMKRLLFNPDGWVVKDVPKESMIGFDFTAYRNDHNTNRSWVGRYKVNGNKVDISWQDYAGNNTEITRNETTANPGWDVYVPMCRCTGHHFSGKYIWGNDQYLQFFTNGTFIDHQTLDQLLVNHSFYEHPRIQQGTYAIQQQTMIFTFSDGSRGMRTFYAPKAQETGSVFNFIGLGWHVLYEEHHANKP
jgi:hypothetical protein